MQRIKPLSEIASAIASLAEQHGVTFRPTATDAWAQNVTRLAGVDVRRPPRIENVSNDLSSSFFTV
jgi:hypothetical protein